MYWLIVATALAASADVPPPSTQPTPDSPPPPAQPTPGATGGNPLARLLALPDISAIGSFAGAYDTADVGQLSPRSGPFGPPHKPTPLFQELELALQSVVDPYARADVFLSFTPEGAEVEEAYLTTLALPAGFQVRAGSFFSPFGRLNQQHPHTWDFVDAPLAMDRLLAADKLKGPGLHVAWLAPLPWFAELHLAAQTTVPAFEADSRRTLVARVQQFIEVASDATLGVGFSGARIEHPLEGASDSIGGVDLLLKVAPGTTRSYLALQGELFARRLTGIDDAGTRLGGYAQAVYRDGPRWAYGLRGEIAPAAVPGTTDVTPSSGVERRVSAMLAWMPSEFQRLRAQLSWDRLPGNVDALEALLQVEFIIGTHGAHKF
jgi:hypothetical protein